MHIVRPEQRPRTIASIERVSTTLAKAPFLTFSPNKGSNVDVTFNCFC